MENRMVRQFCFVAAMVGVPSLSMAQELVPAVAIGSPASIQAQKLTSAQLGDLVAPIALYPDALLSQVLVASTYPLEVVQAQQWLQRNDGLKGQALMDAAREQRWDASVQGLVAFPDALSTLNQDVQWTAALGNAFLAQEADVMTAVQRLRAQAQASGRLASTPQQTVSAVAQEGRTVIEIVPADPQVIYVPQYDPYYVWGAPAWGAYPALGYGYGYGFGPAINVGFWFGGWSWGWGWGWGPNWYGGSVYVNSAFFRHCGYNYGHHGPYYGGGHGGHGGGHNGGNNGGHNGGNNGGHNGGNQAGGTGGRETWQHDAGHRMGVPYSSSRVAGKYDAASRAARATMAGPGAWNRSGGVTTSPSGSRTLNSGTRGSGTEQGWRTGNRSVASGSRTSGADQGWSAGNRSVPSGSRAAGTDQTWRSGNRTASTNPRSGGVDRAWRALADQGRRSQGATQGQGPSTRSSVSSPRYSASAPRTSAVEPRTSAYSPRSSASSSPRNAAPSRSTSAPSQSYSAPSRSYSAPSRSYSSAGPMRGAQSAPRSSSSSGAGRSFGGGGSPSSAGGGSSRGSAGGHGSGGGSQGGGRRH